MSDDGSIEIREQSDYNTEAPTMHELILRHIRKISDISCAEFTAGFWEKKPVKMQGGVMFSEEYHEDKRLAYSNAVDFLTDVVYSLSDDKFKEYANANELLLNLDEQDEDKLNKHIRAVQANRRQMFKQINIMFERHNFFQNTDSIDQ
jgi:hypothetical protein